MPSWSLGMSLHCSSSGQRNPPPTSSGCHWRCIPEPLEMGLLGARLSPAALSSHASLGWAPKESLFQLRCGVGAGQHISPKAVDVCARRQPVCSDHYCSSSMGSEWYAWNLQRCSGGGRSLWASLENDLPLAHPASSSSRPPRRAHGARTSSDSRGCAGEENIPAHRGSQSCTPDHIDCGGKGKGRSLSLSRSDST